MKPFYEALSDGFSHITEITDPDFLHSLREEGIRVDDEGYHSFSFGEHKEYELCVEPFGEEGCYLIAIYKNRIPLNNKLLVWTNEQKPT